MQNNPYETMSVKDAGAKGGKTTLARLGSEHFRTIGKKGQASLAGRVTAEQRHAWGTLGGWPKKLRLQNMGEKGNSDKGGMGSLPNSVSFTPPTHYNTNV